MPILHDIRIMVPFIWCKSWKQHKQCEALFRCVLEPYNTLLFSELSRFLSSLVKQFSVHSHQCIEMLFLFFLKLWYFKHGNQCGGGPGGGVVVVRSCNGWKFVLYGLCRKSWYIDYVTWQTVFFLFLSFRNHEDFCDPSPGFLFLGTFFLGLHDTVQLNLVPNYKFIMRNLLWLHVCL